MVKLFFMERKKGQNSKRWKVYIPASIIVLAVIMASAYWYSNYRKYVSSDDAYLDADRVTVGPKILGRIVSLYADEGDSVKQGMLLAELDSTELQAQLMQNRALRDQSLAGLHQAEAKLKLDEETLGLQEIAFQKANDDYERSETQYEGGVITREQFDHSQKAWESAKVQLNIARSQLAVTRTQIAGGKASVEQSEAQANLIQVQLRNTHIYSPSDGVVAKRWLLSGDVVQPGQSIFTVTRASKLWVTVYLEETKLARIKVNQSALFTIDGVPNYTFHGHVFFIGSNTASQFSLIPANNAAGNFTKITQRVPLKISIDELSSGPDLLKKYHLLSGMSVEVKIIR